MITMLLLLCRPLDYSQALKYFQKAWGILKSVYGEDHPDTQFMKESIEIVKGKMKEK